MEPLEPSSAPERTPEGAAALPLEERAAALLEAHARLTEQLGLALP